MDSIASMPGHFRSILASSADAVELGRDGRAAPPSNASSRSARMSNSSSPGGGDDVERVARAHHRRHDAEMLGAGGVVVAGELGRRVRERRAARCGPGRERCPSVRRARSRPPAASRRPCGARPRPRRRRASAGRPRSTGRRRSRRTAGAWTNSAVRHSSSVTSSDRQLGERLGPLGQRPGDARARARLPPFMSAVPGPYSRSPSRRSGRVRVVRDHRVDVAEQQHPAGARPADGRHQVRGAARRRARHPLGTAACSGSSAVHRAIACSAPSTSPDGEEIATSASSSRSARSAISRGGGDQRVHPRPRTPPPTARPRAVSVCGPALTRCPRGQPAQRRR